MVFPVCVGSMITASITWFAGWYARLPVNLWRVSLISRPIELFVQVVFSLTKLQAITIASDNVGLYNRHGT